MLKRDTQPHQGYICTCVVFDHFKLLVFSISRQLLTGRQRQGEYIGEMESLLSVQAMTRGWVVIIILDLTKDYKTVSSNTPRRVSISEPCGVFRKHFMCC